MSIIRQFPPLSHESRLCRDGHHKRFLTSTGVFFAVVVIGGMIIAALTLAAIYIR